MKDFLIGIGTGIIFALIVALDFAVFSAFLYVVCWAFSVEFFIKPAFGAWLLVRFLRLIIGGKSSESNSTQSR